ncbi:hypothetical protein [Nannocystis radixulma]|uniref:Acyl-CoA carboxylase subunit epsilon n=1 Tax=Nannocystis radixulma TaxID=2995305 RepID=A0ABT5BQQ5_9BACT|nr:hypothetical protein [Nannocystis radixulma]MDC0675895.1 hypothetical protein [Nannocystis radixulma]
MIKPIDGSVHTDELARLSRREAALVVLSIVAAANDRRDNAIGASLNQRTWRRRRLIRGSPRA